MSTAVAILVLATAIGAACTGGVLFGFSAFVMPALERLPASQGVAAMQSINITAVRPPFMLFFAGTAVLSVAVIVVAVTQLDESYAPWLLAGAVLYLVGVFGLTMAYHVPRNDALDALVADAPGTVEAWRTYLLEWTTANHVRAAAGLLAAAALGIAVRVA
jgi:uncharacterized membrane protein